MPFDNEEAARHLEDFARGPVVDTAEATARAFEQAGARIALALGNAARSGELSFNALAESLTQDLARLAINELITAPLQSLFSPGAGSGSVNKAAGRPTTINMNISGVTDAGSFTRSQSQISASLARAVRDGQRYI